MSPASIVCVPFLSNARPHRAGGRGILGDVQFDEVLTAFVDAFEDAGVDYAITGDLALHLSGYLRARPRLDFVASPAARDVAPALGFRVVRVSEHVTVYARDEVMVAIIFGEVRNSLPAFIDGRMMAVLDPARRLPLTDEDVAALDHATTHLQPDLSGRWLSFMSRIAPAPRGNTDADEPFEL